MLSPRRLVVLALWSLIHSSPTIAEPGAAAHDHPAHDHADAHQMHGMRDMQVRPLGHGDCGEGEVWHFSMGMCQPLAWNQSFRHLMVMGNAFLVGATQSDPRGRDGISAPDMLMANAGTTWAGYNYLDLSVMLTAERWTLPERGYPELLQIGEHDANGSPFLDAQHPHSSPLMGLTLSNTYTLSSRGEFVRVFVAPRGMATDGPTPFMHRGTGLVNPDAPLGHHIGQDIAHVTSTVIGGTLKWGSTQWEASIFHGTEPEPTRVDLPLGTPNSVALRVIQEIGDVAVMGSASSVKDPEPDEPSTEMRYSLSGYVQRELENGWKFYDTVILGAVTNYDRAHFLFSSAEEFLLLFGRGRAWGRVELLQRTPRELAISTSDLDSGRLVLAATLGGTFAGLQWEGWNLGLGGSLTYYALPSEFSSAYGGNPWAAKLFLHATGMSMLML